MNFYYICNKSKIKVVTGRWSGLPLFLLSGNFFLKYRYFTDAGLRREMKYESMKMFSHQERCYCILDVKVERYTYTSRRYTVERRATLAGAERSKIGRRCRRYKSLRFHPARALYMSGMHLTAVAHTYAQSRSRVSHVFGFCSRPERGTRNY